MLKPTEALTKDLEISTYSLVIGIAKKAREIAVDAEIRGEILTEKPVDMAVQEYMSKDFAIIETEPCPVCGRLDCICEESAPIAVQEAEAEADEPADSETTAEETAEAEAEA